MKYLFFALALAFVFAGCTSTTETFPDAHDDSKPQNAKPAISNPSKQGSSSDVSEDSICSLMKDLSNIEFDQIRNLPEESRLAASATSFGLRWELGTHGLPAFKSESHLKLFKLIYGDDGLLRPGRDCHDVFKNFNKRGNL